MTATPLLRVGLAVALGTAAALAHAKLPPPSDEAKAKAAETAARTAWTGKVDAYKLCQAQDRVVARYRADAQAAGKPVPAAPTPAPAACVDPGPFAYTPPEQKPLEASGAHSPAGTATSPPSTPQPAAAVPKQQ